MRNNKEMQNILGNKKTEATRFRYTHWLKVGDTRSDWQALKEYYDKYDCEINVYYKDGNIIYYYIELKCNQPYAELDLCVNNFSSNIQRLNHKPTNIYPYKRSFEEFAKRFDNSLYEEKVTEATLNKFQTMTTDKNGNEMLLKDVSYNNACSWLEKELAKAGSKVIDTETKGNKTIIKADNKTKFEYDEEKGTLKRLEEAIDYKDDKITVTTAEDPEDDRAYYGKNMTKRDKVRSLDQAKRNLDRMEKDPRVTQGQAIDQVSFDSALDTDLARYKQNKNMAKIDKAQGNDFWADEHNKTARQFADKIRAKHKKQEDIEDIEDTDEEELDINLEDTISLLDMALSEIPTIGVEDWGKDDELLFIADTKVMFEHLKNYEEEIPKYYYDNASNDDWSNGIDSYLEEIKGVNINNGDSDNTYNWNAPLTHDVEFTMYEADDGCYFKGSIHRTGDVRGNYTTEFLLKFNDKDDCLESLFDTCSENCYRSVTVDDIEYVVSPHFFNEYVDIWNTKTQESYDDVYCDCIERLKEIISNNTDDEPTQY